MKIEEYLEKNQQIPYKIFKNALERKTFFHAYLLNGSLGTPLLEIAKFLAKSILCDDENTVFACDNCINCERIENNTYADFIIVDGKSQTIKKEDIQNIITAFSSTSTEKKGIKIYIINLVENMNVESINALLKFLEEPPTETYAILTTENKYRVLPTILSRTEIIDFSLIDKNELIKNATNLGANKEDAEILSFFYNDANTILNISKDDDFIASKEITLNALKKISDPKEFIFEIEVNVIPSLKTKEEIRFFFDFMIVFFKEALKYSFNEETFLESYVNILQDLIKSCSHLDESILTLINARNELNYNVNTSLLIIHAFKKALEV